MIARRKDLALRFMAGAEITVLEIADEYGVSLKTAKRDVDALRAAGLLEIEEKRKIYRAKEKHRRSGG